MMEKRERYTTFLDKKQIEGLKTLSSLTRVPMAIYVREAIDDLLVKYEKELKKAKKGGK
jgi:predicted DNA-binding protein